MLLGSVEERRDQQAHLTIWTFLLPIYVDFAISVKVNNPWPNAMFFQFFFFSIVQILPPYIFHHMTFWCSLCHIFGLMFLWFKYSPMFHTFTSDQQFTSYKILSSLFPMMTTIHQRNRNVSNDDDTLANPAQNLLPWVLQDKYITDQLTIPLILSLLFFLFSLFLPSMNKSLFKKCNVLLSLMTNNSSMNRIFHIQFHLCSNFLC